MMREAVAMQCHCFICCVNPSHEMTIWVQFCLQRSHSRSLYCSPSVLQSVQSVLQSFGVSKRRLCVLACRAVSRQWAHHFYVMMMIVTPCGGKQQHTHKKGEGHCFYKETLSSFLLHSKKRKVIRNMAVHSICCSSTTMTIGGGGGGGVCTHFFFSHAWGVYSLLPQ